MLCQGCSRLSRSFSLPELRKTISLVPAASCSRADLALHSADFLGSNFVFLLAGFSSKVCRCVYGLHSPF